MAKTRGIACDRCAKVVQVDRDQGWRQVILRKRTTDGGWDAKETVDFCPACAHELGKWLRAYKGEDDAEQTEPGHQTPTDQPSGQVDAGQTQ